MKQAAAQNTKVDLSIIIPVYMERARIGQSLDQLAEYLTQPKYTQTEVLVVVARSSDDTLKLARSKVGKFQNCRVIDDGPQIGKGRQVRTGMMEAKGQYKIFMDVDLATPLHHLEEVRVFAQRGGDILIGVRQLNIIHHGLRRVISEAGNLLVRVLLLPDVPDSQCGFKAFSAPVADEVFRRQTIMGWGFDMEILAIARQLRYKIEKLPIPDWSDQPNGTFENQVKSAAAETLGELFVIWWRRLRGRYRQKTYSYRAFNG